MSLLLPDKHQVIDVTLVGQASFVLSSMSGVARVAALWLRFKSRYPDAPYERFVLALDVLYSLGIIDMRENVLTLASGADA